MVNSLNDEFEFGNEIDLVRLVRSAFSNLNFSTNQQKVIQSLYYLDLNQTQTAEKMGISHARVHQIKLATFKKLRSYLSPHLPPYFTRPRITLEQVFYRPSF